MRTTDQHKDIMCRLDKLQEQGVITEWDRYRWHGPPGSIAEMSRARPRIRWMIRWKDGSSSMTTSDVELFILGALVALDRFKKGR
jgi:hypothetical protein